MKKIHRRQAVAEVAQIIAARPDHIYAAPKRTEDDATQPGCLYAHEAGPGCIIGQWLYTFHGFDLDKLRRLDGQGSIMELVSGDFNALPFQLTSRALTFLRGVQYHQDKRESWSAALWKALES